jgi:hypothetical protein
MSYKIKDKHRRVIWISIKRKMLKAKDLIKNGLKNPYRRGETSAIKEWQARLDEIEKEDKDGR